MKIPKVAQTVEESEFWDMQVFAMLNSSVKKPKEREGLLNNLFGMKNIIKAPALISAFDSSCCKWIFDECEIRKRMKKYFSDRKFIMDVQEADAFPDEDSTSHLELLSEISGNRSASVNINKRIFEQSTEQLSFRSKLNNNDDDDNRGGGVFGDGKPKDLNHNKSPRILSKTFNLTK